MEWIEISIKVTRDMQEAVSNLLFEMGISGVVIEDSKDILNCKQQDCWDYIDENLFEQLDYMEDYVVIKAYIVNDVLLHDKLNFINERLNYIEKNCFPNANFDVDLKKIYQQDWENNWKKYYKTFNIGKNIVVKPVWEKQNDKHKNKIVVEIDPGMAFGTGTHETTSTCMKMLEKYIKPGDKLIDVGCGSGILSIAAAKLGCSKVIALDIDDNAIHACKKNVMVNNVSDIVQVNKRNLLDGIDIKVNIITANIIADVILELCKKAHNNLVSSGIFISSGIINQRYNDVVHHLYKHNYKIIDTQFKGEWVTIVSVYEGV